MFLAKDTSEFRYRKLAPFYSVGIYLHMLIDTDKTLEGYFKSNKWNDMQIVSAKN